MSCETPFVYGILSSIVETKQTVVVNGSFQLPEYSTPSTQSCLLALSEYPIGKWKFNINSLSWNWSDCGTVPGIEIWPTLNFTASCNIPIIFEAIDGFVITVEGGQVYETASMTINECNLTLGINGTDVSINIIPSPIIVIQTNGNFSTNIELNSYIGSYDYLGVDYKLTINPKLLFCLDPVPHSGWINLTLNCVLNATGDEINYLTGFTILCPIVSVE